jgi:hypothetical protein
MHSFSKQRWKWFFEIVYESEDNGEFFDVAFDNARAVDAMKDIVTTEKYRCPKMFSSNYSLRCYLFIFTSIESRITDLVLKDKIKEIVREMQKEIHSRNPPPPSPWFSLF